MLTSLRHGKVVRHWSSRIACLQYDTPTAFTSWTTACLRNTAPTLNLCRLRVNILTWWLLRIISTARIIQRMRMLTMRKRKEGTVYIVNMILISVRIYITFIFLGIRQIEYIIKLVSFSRLLLSVNKIDSFRWILNLHIDNNEIEKDKELKIAHSMKKVPSKTEKEMELLIESSLEKVFLFN